MEEIYTATHMEKKLQEQVAKAIEKEGFKVLRTKVGVKNPI